MNTEFVKVPITRLEDCVADLNNRYKELTEQISERRKSTEIYIEKVRSTNDAV